MDHRTLTRNEFDESDLKPNSNKYKEEMVQKQQEIKTDISKEKLSPVTTNGQAVKSKKTLGDRFREVFLKADIASVGQYLLYDVVVPAAKNALSEAVSSGINMFLFGENRPSNNVNRKGDRSYVSYNRYYNHQSNSRYSAPWDDGQTRTIVETRPINNRRNRQFDQVIVPSRTEAEDVLEAVLDRIDTYGVASVADLYDLSGVPSVFTDNDWGWYNADDAHVRRTQGGYMIWLPQPRLLRD